ncbi:MAG: ATP-binding protein [Candidatus Omnitrophica bacterium]|nr:ATP-binding protein [Candidatus Omnitrophota bacterium]
MVKALKLKGHKGIKEVNIVDLEHINVLSGKNNSGKSSILEAVQDKAKRSLGVLFKEENLENLAKIYRPLINTSSPSPDQILDTFRQFIKTHNGEYLYKDYEKDYVDEFSKIFQQKYHQNYGNSYSFDRFFRVVVSQEEDNFKPCLIDPKRKIGSVTKIDTAVKLSTNGDNLLNDLFFLKNQEPYSKEYKSYVSIFDSFKQITNGAQFNILPDKGNNIKLQFRIDKCDGWVDADNCGLGLREVLLIVSFVFSPEFDFIQIEEPENHLHPEYQRKLLRFIDSAIDKQFLISTHSNIFLDTSYVDKVFLTYFNGQVCIEEKTNKAKILNELGYSPSDNLISDLIILTEGPKDFPAIEEFLKKIEGLAGYAIKFWPLGGDIMSQVDLSILKENSNLIALIDNDPGSKTHREKFKEHCKSLNIECFQLKRYALENYFSIKAIRDVFQAQISKDITEIKPDKKIDSQIGINVKNNSRKIVGQMGIDEIKNTDLYEFLVRVETILKNSSSP